MKIMGERRTCRRCGACCIALSISSPIPGLPEGKPAGIRCPHLDGNHLCLIYHSKEKPDACTGWKPSKLCGNDFHEAMKNLEDMERETSSA